MLVCRDTQSDTSSISQSSYDPNMPEFSGMASEIPDAQPEETDSGGGITLVSTKTRQTDVTSSDTASSGGITLVSSRPRPEDAGMSHVLIVLFEFHTATVERCVLLWAAVDCHCFFSFVP